jgi:hypothetical protein
MQIDRIPISSSNFVHMVMKLLDRKAPPREGGMVVEDGVLPDLLELMPSLCRERSETLAALSLRSLIRRAHTTLPELVALDSHALKYVSSTDFPRLPHFAASGELRSESDQAFRHYRGLFLTPNGLRYGREFECEESPECGGVTGERIPLKQAILWVRQGYSVETLRADLAHAIPVLLRRAEEAWGERGDEGRWDLS